MTSTCESVEYIKGLRTVPHHDHHDREPLEEPGEVGEAMIRQQPVILAIFKTLLQILVRNIPSNALDSFL